MFGTREESVESGRKEAHVSVAVLEKPAREKVLVRGRSPHERELLRGRARVWSERRELKLLVKRRAGEAHVAEDVLRSARCLRGARALARRTWKKTC